MLLIFLDTETSGRNPEKHRILEIAFRVVEHASWKPVLSYESIIHQPAEIWAEADPESLAFNGFTWEENLKGKSEKAISAEILYDLNRMNIRERTGAFVCQNPSFDKVFFLQLISEEMQRHLGWPYHWLDLASMYFSKKYFTDPETFKTFKEKDLSKDKIARSLGLSEETMPHRAMRGVDHLLACYKKLFEID